MMGREKKQRARDRTNQRRRNRGSQVLPVATTALHHFFIFLSGIPSLWCSLFVPLSLLSSISSQLSLTVYLAHTALSFIQPVSPGNGTNLTLTSVCIRAGRTRVRASVPSMKACGSNSRDSRVTESTPQWEGQRFSPHGTESSSLLTRFFHALCICFTVLNVLFEYFMWFIPVNLLLFKYFYLTICIFFFK